MKIIVTNTPGILHLVNNAAGRNRSIYEKKFASKVDVNGTHVLGMSIPHNDDGEIRTLWVCKMKDSAVPVEIWLDVDFCALDEVTSEIETAPANTNLDEFGRGLADI